MIGNKWLNSNGSVRTALRADFSAMLDRAWERFKAETRVNLGGADGGLSDFTGTWPVKCEDGVSRRLTICEGRRV